MSEITYMSIKDAAKATGLAEYFVRKAAISGYAPTIKSGKKYYINVPALLAKLEAESAAEE